MDKGDRGKHVDLTTGSDNPSLNSELETAVENQGVVTPQDYPESERREQTIVATSPDKPRTGKPDA
jgi:hypothetical protein